MNYEIDALFQRLSKPFDRFDGEGRIEYAIEFPVDYAEHLLTLDRSWTPLPPEITWTLLYLLHYRSRRRWAWRVFTKNLNGQRLQPLKGPGRKKRRVPALADWVFKPVEQFWALLINRRSGEQIGIDIIHGPESFFGAWGHVESVRATNAAAQRLNELFPQGRGLGSAIEHLRGCMQFPHAGPYDLPDETPRELHTWVRNYSKVTEAFLAAWEEPERRLALAMLIGDWAYVMQAAAAEGMEELACRAVAEAERGRRRWVNLLRVSWDEGPNKDSLLALTHAHASDLRECLEFAFTRPSLRAAAMEIVADDPLWVPQVLDMVLRGHSGNVGVPMEDATRYLIKQGYSVAALIRALLENRGFNWAMSLSLEFAPSYLKTVLKQRLRSQYWHDRLEASAILIASGSAWGREELLRRLEECESHNESIEVRSALGRSGDAEAIAAIEQWEATHPKKKPPRGGSGRAAYRKQGGCRADLEKVVQKFGNRLAEIGHLLDGDCEGQIEMSGEDDAATRKIAIVG